MHFGLNLQAQMTATNIPWLTSTAKPNRLNDRCWDHHILPQRNKDSLYLHPYLTNCHSRNYVRGTMMVPYVRLHTKTVAQIQQVKTKCVLSSPLNTEIGMLNDQGIARINHLCLVNKSAGIAVCLIPLLVVMMDSLIEEWCRSLAAVLCTMVSIVLHSLNFYFCNYR